jgi:hypothetical protein
MCLQNHWPVALTPDHSACAISMLYGRVDLGGMPASLDAATLTTTGLTPGQSNTHGHGAFGCT